MVLQKAIRLALLTCILTLSGFSEADLNNQKNSIPTHADAAIIIAKHTGLFDHYIESDATLNECVVFLNKHGIYFGLLEVVNGKEFTLNDCARVMGQIELIFSGEAEYFVGKVKLPKNIDSWKEFCIMSGVNYKKGYSMFININSDCVY